MNFSNGTIQGIVEQLCTSTSEVDNALGENFKLEANLSPQRISDYEPIVHAATDYAELNRLHKKNYLKRYIEVFSKDTVADTFLPINVAAQFGELEGNQWLIRLERLDGRIWAATNGINFEQLVAHLNVIATSNIVNKSAAMASKVGSDLTDSQFEISDFLKRWDEVCDGRPCYATFKSEHEAQLASPDWAALLRDRLGLAHFEQGDQVALMCYQVSDIVARSKAQKVSEPFSKPTVLDSEWNAFFMPTPLGVTYGATLDLSGQTALCSEVLHLPFVYQTKHLLKLGTVSRPYALDTQAGELTAARKMHLSALEQREVADGV